MFDAAMHAAPRGSSEQTATWFVEADRVSANPRARKFLRMGGGDDATSAHAAIVSSLFLVVLAASLLFGGHAAIDPLLRSAAAARDAKAVGDVVYSMPDGKFCRHMSFDNLTAEMVEGTVVRCPDDVVRDEFRNKTSGFAWVAH
jgi:hypothetical protein